LSGEDAVSVSRTGVDVGVVFVGVDVGEVGSEEAMELDREAVVRRFRGVMTLTAPVTRAKETRRGSEEDEKEEEEVYAVVVMVDEMEEEKEESTRVVLERGSWRNTLY